MRSHRFIRGTALYLVIVLSVVSARAWPRRHGSNMRVHFVATSTLVRGTWGLNEDTYLAQLLLTKSGQEVLVRLVDAYPNEWPPLSREVLISQSGTMLRVKRDTQCDLPYSRMLLRTAPGDPMSIVLDKFSYQPELNDVPRGDAIVQCFRVVRP